MRLEGEAALVTGGGSGIGRAVALLFAREGASVVVSDSVESAGEDTVRAIKNEGKKSAFVKGDVSKSEDAKRMVEKCLIECGKLTILFNNAGFNIFGSVDELDENDWNRLIEVNLKGTFLVSKYAVKEMLKQKNGSIVNNASTLGFVSNPRDAAYCASKGGVIALTRQMAFDYAKHGIRVNCVCAGPTLTPRMERTIQSHKNPHELRKEILSRVLFDRFATPEEIAYPVLFLASKEASFITGSALVVDGGQTIH
ncbi:MAG: glucose 1-dehydrogenase [Nitrososphaerota archaeon]|nr:glucose 1-dehydrogenase [Nitrososphaerota archaeon]